jgi:hypothetical protein
MSSYGKTGENRSFKGSNYPLRLQSSLMAEARRVAKSEGVSLNQLINVAVAEKLSALRTERHFQERILRAAPAGILQILEQARKLKSSAGGGESQFSRPHASPEAFGAKVQPASNREAAGETATLAGTATPQLGKLKRQRDKARGR